MIIWSACRGLLAAAFVSALTLPAAAQQAASPPAAAPAAAPALPPGSPLIGRPADNAAAAKLAPVAPPPIPAAADKLPAARLKLPPGFNIEVYAAGMANARSLREGDKGTVSSAAGWSTRSMPSSQGRQTLGQGARLASIARTVSPSMTARCTSPNF